MGEFDLSYLFFFFAALKDLGYFFFLSFFFFLIQWICPVLRKLFGFQKNDI